MPQPQPQEIAASGEHLESEGPRAGLQDPQKRLLGRRLPTPRICTVPGGDTPGGFAHTPAQQLGNPGCLYTKAPHMSPHSPGVLQNAGLYFRSHFPFSGNVPKMEHFDRGFQ